jgi:pyrroloquinoline-quinone synthase
MRTQLLDSIIESKCLLKHPFYRAWNEGTLHIEHLAVYASQYGEFIDTIATGWDTAGDPATADEERQHAMLWSDFAAGLNAPRPAGQRLPEIEELVALANRMFAHRATALGALYAFEKQQPATAQSKLDGLRRHYQLPATAEVYFDVHKSDEEEPRWLAAQIEALGEEEFAQALAACDSMASALWKGLDGVMAQIQAHRHD